jgi:peptidyl-prolyl cis-trans isomerase A (cyclophilin A)
MIQRLLLAVLLTALSTPLIAQTRTVWMETTQGPIYLELDEVAAPIATANFIDYVEDGFYDGLIFFRVLENFIIQAGFVDAQLNIRQPTRPPIAGQPDNGLSNAPYTIAMAQIPSDINSATSQFFINTGQNSSLDEDFTVFGEVIAGRPTVDRIQSAETFLVDRFPFGSYDFQDFPAAPAEIVRAFETDGYPLVPLHTGSWFDPENPGRGLNVEIANGGNSGDDATLVLYLYDFTGGNQFWLAGNVNYDFGPSAVTVPMLILDGPDFGDAFDPDDRNIEEWGTITFEVTGCDTAIMTYDSPGFGSGTRPLTRLTRPNGLATCEGL